MRSCLEQDIVSFHSEKNGTCSLNFMLHLYYSAYVIFVSNLTYLACSSNGISARFNNNSTTTSRYVKSRNAIGGLKRVLCQHTS